MCFLYKNSKSLLTECLLSTAFPTSLEYQDALLASKLVAAWKNLQPWNFWQKGPRPDPCFCFFGGKVINCFSGCIHDFRKLKFREQLPKGGRQNPLTRSLLCKSHWAFCWGFPLNSRSFTGFLNVQKTSLRKWRTSSRFFYHLPCTTEELEQVNSQHSTLAKVYLSENDPNTSSR